VDSGHVRLARIAVRASTVEIRVHQFLLFIIFLPFAGILLPFLGFHIACSLLNSNLSQDWRNWKHIRQVEERDLLSETQELGLAGTLTGVVFVYGLTRYVKGLHALRSTEEADSRYRPLKPTQGNILRERGASLWREAVASRSEPPEILWFPNVAVLARALSNHGVDRMAVSTGLWERVEKGDQTAELILLHEMAHLRYHDPDRFRRYQAMLAAIQRALSITFFSFAFIVAFLGFHQAFALFSRAPLGTLLRQESMILGVGFIVISLCPITGAIVRRYLGFITSLRELRADVKAAEWAGGLDYFADILSRNEMVHKSTLADRSRSWFSLNLTHLSETERVDTIRDPARLLTPKTEYFLFSLILALVLPFNGLTPLFEGGLADLVVSMAVAVAFSLTTTMMLTLAAETPVGIPVTRLFGLALGFVGFTAACQLNLYTVAYSLMTVAVEFGLPSPDTPVNLKEILHDIGSSFKDIGDQLNGIVSHGWVIGSLLVTFVALWLLIWRVRRISGKRQIGRISLLLVGLASAVGVIIDGYDHWRTFELEGTWLDTLWVGWQNVWARLPWLRFSLSAILPMVVVWAISLSFRKDSIAQ
jgi:Zn-dependent protease with chaperone function